MISIKNPWSSPMYKSKSKVTLFLLGPFPFLFFFLHNLADKQTNQPTKSQKDNDENLASLAEVEITVQLQLAGHKMSLLMRTMMHRLPSEKKREEVNLAWKMSSWVYENMEYWSLGCLIGNELHGYKFLLVSDANRWPVSPSSASLLY